MASSPSVWPRDLLLGHCELACTAVPRQSVSPRRRASSCLAERATRVLCVCLRASAPALAWPPASQLQQPAASHNDGPPGCACSTVRDITRTARGHRADAPHAWTDGRTVWCGAARGYHARRWPCVCPQRVHTRRQTGPTSGLAVRVRPCSGHGARRRRDGRACARRGATDPRSARCAKDEPQHASS